MALIQEPSKDKIRAIVFDLLKAMGEKDNMKFGEVRISYSLVYRDGKPAYLKCIDPLEHSVDLRDGKLG